LIGARDIGALIAALRTRAMAALYRQFRDVDLAEDAFQEACLKATQTWCRDGIPRDALAWLIFVGRNAGIDSIRRAATHRGHAARDAMPDANAEVEYLTEFEREFCDDVLRLLFMCAHPGLPLQDQLALSLKIVVGLPVQRIARAFATREKTMGQRIMRSKQKAAAVGGQFEVLTHAERADRLSAVLAMLYLMFNEGYSNTSSDEDSEVLCVESIRLLRELLALFPNEAELMGLLSLAILQHARRKARLSTDGRLLTLAEQNRSLWHFPFIAEGRNLLEKALRKRQPGPYQIQAAIATMHCRASRYEDTDWDEIVRLYTLLEAFDPSPVVALNKAAAVAQASGPNAALELLGPLHDSLAHYLHFHTMHAALCATVGRNEEARWSYKRALGLNPTESEAAHVREKLARL